MSKQILYVVIPCYNEAVVLPETSKRLQAKMESLIKAGTIAETSRVLFVDDGSKDTTWQLIETYHQNNPLFKGVKLAHNKGHQNALLAGLTTAFKDADVTISMDADLQDDIEAMDKMLAAYQDGAQIVYGVRSKRKKDSFLKRFTAQKYYKLMRRMGIETVYNHADYRLMSKQAVAALLKYDESNLYLRGIIPQLGFSTAEVEYERDRRFAGKSKYSLKKMLQLAIDGITSFSINPLLLIFWLGIFFDIAGVAAFATTLVLHYTIALSAMWPVLSAILLTVGILLTALGMIAVYVGKTYMEIKHRPRFIVEKEI